MENGHTAKSGRMLLLRAAVRRLGMIVMALVLLAGCAQEEAFKRGEKLSRQGQYDQAVTEMETAIRLAEEHNDAKAAQRYRQRLDQVKQQAGQFYYREAQLRFGRADLGAALGFIEKTIAYCPQEQSYPAFHQRVLKAIADAEQLRTEGLSLAEQQQWRAAVQKMNEALARYRTMPGGDADLRQIKEKAYRYYLERAQDQMRQDNLKGAEAEAQIALTFQESGREAKQILQEVNDRREAAKLIARGRTFLAQGDAEEALSDFEQAQRLQPSHPDLPDLLGKARRAVCDKWLAQGRRMMETHDDTAAMHLFLKSQDLLRGYGGVDSLLSDVRSRLGNMHLDTSREYLQAGADGCAVLHAAVALGYQPDSPDGRRQLGQCAELVRREVGYTMAFVGFRSSRALERMAARFGAAGLQHLTRNHPANVIIVERVDLGTILDEQNLNVSGLIDPQSRVAGGRLQGVDALIVGQVLDADVRTESKREGYGESTYQDGYRSEPNPDHVHAAEALDAAIHDLERARERLAEAEARLARFSHVDPANEEEMVRKRKAQADVDEAKQRLANAATDVGTTRIRLATIPPEVLVPNMVQHRYPIETFTRTAKITGMLKVLDTATGEVLAAESLDGQYAESDRVIAGDPRRNVPEDPLTLPDEVLALERAADPAITRLKQVLDQACKQHGRRFLVQMQRAEAAGDVEQAVDGSVKYLFAYPDGNEQTPRVLDVLHKYLGDEDGLIDLRQLLRTHCQVALN